MTAPLVPVAAAFLAGVWLGLLMAPPTWLPVAAIALGGLAIAALQHDRLAAASLAVLLLVGLGGWARATFPDPSLASGGLRPGRAVLEGVITGTPETDGPRTRLPLHLQTVADPTGPRAATGPLVVHLYGRSPALVPGQRIRVTADIREVRPFRNPGSVPHILAPVPGEPRLVAVGRTDALVRLPPGPVPWWLAARVALHRLVTAHLPPVSGALFEGLLIGERRRLPPTLVADFRAAGVFHILAISGFNVGLVAAAIFLVLRLGRLSPRAAAGIALGALAAFATVVGGQPSVLRATLMATLVLGGRLLGREPAVWNSLAAALLALLLWEPASLADAGFQLSFAATAGILHLGPPLRACLPRAWPGPLAQAVAVSASAQLAVTPLLLAHWNEASLIAVVANLAVVPLAAAVTTLGLVAVLLALVSDALGHLVFQSLWALLLALRLVVRLLAALPGAAIHAPTPPALALGAAAAALALAPLAGRRGRAIVAALGLVAMLATAARARPDGHFRLLVLDVGQGDAILVRGPDGQALLVDTGGGGPGRADRGERVVLPALRRLGVRRLAAVAVTHDDPDHAGGLAGLVTRIPIGEVWVPTGAAPADWARTLAAIGVGYRTLGRGDRVWLGPLLVTVLHPPHGPVAPAWSRAGDDNNRSLVLRVEWGLAAVLLTGDAETPAERELLAAGVPVAAPVLKVGHHGSRYGSAAGFLERVGPRVAVMSVGARNPFGHPSPPTLGRLATARARIYRTDLDGAVEVTSDGTRLVVRRWADPGRVETLALGGAP